MRQTFVFIRQAVRANAQVHAAKLEVVRSQTNAAQSKVDFVASLAHDTGNAIMVIDATVDRLVDVQQSIPTIAPCLKVMKLCIKMLVSARERSMDCARSKNGEYLNPKYAPVELYPLLQDLKGMTNLFMASSAIQFIFQVESSLTSHPIYSSREWLNDMLLNFISNASKYTETGRIVVSVYQVDGGKGICLEVTDSGRGIPDKYKFLLFNKFARVETIKAEEEQSNRCSSIEDVSDDDDITPDTGLYTPASSYTLRRIRPSFFGSHRTVHPCPSENSPTSIQSISARAYGTNNT